MTYITKIINNKIKKSRYIAADFETMIIENKHYVFSIGYKNSVDKITSYNYIRSGLNTIEEIKLESEKLVYEFILSLSRDNKKKYVYFHNLKSFDGVFILRSIVNNIEKKDEFKCIMRNSKIYRMTYKKVIFLDTMLILNDSLDNIANKFLNKGKISIDYKIMETYEKIFINQHEILQYLTRDVEILFDILEILIERFKKDYNIDITKNFTIPSIALNLYRRKYMKKNEI